MRGFSHLLMMDDGQPTNRLFACLGEGGTVTTPVGIQPWGGYGGTLTNQFGVQ